MRRVPAPALVLGGIASVQIGAAIAKGLFDRLGPAGTVWLRMSFGALVLLLIWRPRLEREGLRTIVLFALVLGTMNLCFYEAIDRLPLGVAVTLEFFGPLGVALAGSRRALDLVWVGLAGTGIVLLGGSQAGGAWVGIVFALVAGGLWGAYILLGARLGRVGTGGSALTISMAIAAVLLAPFGIVGAGSSLLDLGALATGAGVAILASAIPYTLEIEALRRLPAHVFGVLMSLEPAVAALAGVVILGQALGTKEWIAIAFVVVASAGAARGARTTIKPEI